MAGVPTPINVKTLNDVLERPILTERGKAVGHFRWIEKAKETRPFMKLYQDGSNTELARNRAVAATELRVYLALLDRLDYKNEIAVTQVQLGHDLDIQKANLAKALQKLETLGVIRRGPKRGTVNTYALNRAFGNKGDAP